MGTEDVFFCKAEAHSINKGVFSQKGDTLPSQHNEFVDDNLMADIP